MTFCSTLLHFGGFWLPERLINLHLCTELTVPKLSFHYSVVSHKLESVSAREHRFNLVVVDRSTETFLRVHLAFDRSNMNCAINWATRNRCLLLSCLANTFVLCVFGVLASISFQFMLRIPLQQTPRLCSFTTTFNSALRMEEKAFILPTLSWSFYCVVWPMCQNVHTAVLLKFLYVNKIKSTPNMSRKGNKQCLLE